MATKTVSKPVFHPVTPERWKDLETLFGPRGGVGGCWCMYWRETSKEYMARRGNGNKKAIKALVASREPPGIIAYVDGQPAGWCSLAPRPAFPRLATSRVLKPVDEQPVWSIVCFFIARPFRRQGLSAALITAAVGYAKKRGAKIMEAYPVEPRKEMAGEFAWTGFADAFRKAGFKEVARRSETRPIMRFELK